MLDELLVVVAGKWRREGALKPAQLLRRRQRLRGHPAAGGVGPRDEVAHRRIVLRDHDVEPGRVGPEAFGPRVHIAFESAAVSRTGADWTWLLSLVFSPGRRATRRVLPAAGLPVAKDAPQRRLPGLKRYAHAGAQAGTGVQARSTGNTATLRSSLLNLTPMTVR